MALATQHLQGSCRICPSRPSSCSSRSKLKHFVKLRIVEQKESFVSLKCKSCLSVGAPLVLRPIGKQLKVSAFKAFEGNGHNEESGKRAARSKSLRSSVKLSYAPEENEETLVEPPKANNTPISYSSMVETSTRFLSMHNPFGSWLSLLHSVPSNEGVKATMQEPSPIVITEAQSLPERKARIQIVKAVQSYFMRLNASIMIPLLIFVPLYLTVNFVYGAEVSKELTPLWVLGPLVVALYSKVLRGICALYVFSFKQTAKVIKNLPAYYRQLKEDITARLLQPVVDIRNLDYKELSRDFQNFLVEKYLDFVESVWPSYCRTIRFLKRANLI